MKAIQHMVTVDHEHLTNIVSNLLDNANKYSPEKPQIQIRTSNEAGKIRIEIIDNGIGIKRENQQDVFKKFHRLQTGNIHDAKGFGIGLFYVKTMMEKMGGHVELDSEPNKGSNFTLTFPV
ncbi:MAG: ATP-binding protein [Bacteroidales bacterium]